MATFLRIGENWVNVDNVAYVEVRGDVADPREPRCVVHFMGPGKLTVKGDDAKKLLEYLAGQRGE